MANPVSVGIKVGMMALQMGLTAMTKIEGPRLKSREVTTADYGTPMERLWGKKRLTGRPIIHAEKLREKKTTSKTKGGKYSDYKYFGTFAVLIADQQIDSVTRIWMDKHLVYDVTQAGPISPLAGFFQGLQGSPVKLKLGRNFRIYTGTQTGPDPRYEDWCEDRYGPDSAPSYKDVSYLFFEDIPLEKFGNRIPQIDVEAVNVSTVDYLYDEQVKTGGSEITFSADYSRFTAQDGWIWDTATRTRIAPITFTPDAWPSAGEIYNLTDSLGTGGGPYLYTVTNDGQMVTGPIVVPVPVDQVWGVGGAIYFRPFAASGVHIYYIAGAEVVSLNIGFAPTDIKADSEGNTWVAGRPDSVSEIALYCISGDRQGDSYAFASGSSDFVRLMINGQDDFVLEQNGNLWRLASDFSLIDSASVPATGTFSHTSLSDTFWRVSSSAALEYSTLTLTLIRSISEGAWVGAADISSGVYDPINHAIISANSGKITWRFLDRVGSDGVDLGDVISDVAGWCGVTDFDVSGLTQTVQGYSVVQGPGKDMIGPLLDIHDVDARPHDFGIQFLSRGGSASTTIPVIEFVREGDEPRYTISVAQDTDLPAQISIMFADQDKDQQVNTVIAKRTSLSVDSVRNQQIDLSTYVGTPGDMQKYADRYLRRKWNGRETVTNSLTSQYLGVEPGDLTNLQLDDVTQSVRLKKWTLSQGRIQAEWERDFVSLHALGTGTGAEFQGRDDDAIYIAGPTKGLVKDIPLTEDVEASDNPLLHYAAGTYGDFNWPGATIYEGDGDGDDYLPWKGVEAADKATWGYASDALGDADPWLWDRGNTVNVSTYAALVSSTEAAINADPTVNLALLGDELINFVTATLESDGTYTLSGFKRGRRGTEWACSTHEAGDEFVMVSSFAADSLGLSDVGLTLFYKAQSVGRDVSEAPEISFAFTGASLKPYAPARLKWTTDGTDLTGTIIRRTRVGGSWVGGTTIPISEASEAYEVDIYSGVTFKRTISVSGTNVFTYTAAQMSADGLSTATRPNVNVYQMSDAVGRGFALAA